MHEWENIIQNYGNNTLGGDWYTVTTFLAVSLQVIDPGQNKYVTRCLVGTSSFFVERNSKNSQDVGKALEPQSFQANQKSSFIKWCAQSDRFAYLNWPWE